MKNLKYTNNILFGSLTVGFLAVTILSFGLTPALAAVTHLPEDEYLSYGYREWAVKNYKNQHNDLDASFGRNIYGSNTGVSSDCSSSYTNFAKLHVENDGNSAGIAWQGIFQGTDPWGNRSIDNYRLGTQDAIYDSYENDLSDDNLPESGTAHITASMQWCWTDELQPDDYNDHVKGNILMNLWYYDEDSNKAVVIDLMFDRVRNSNGSWVQDNGLDVGDLYSTPHKSTDGGKTVYHYGVVINDRDTNENSLYSATVNVDDYIDDAFDYNYSGSDTGSRSNYQLVSIECGAEITNSYSYDGGALNTEIFKCDARS